MAENSSIVLASISAEKADDGYTLKIKLVNTGKRTMHAYASARRIQYDSATKTLNIDLNDDHVDDGGILSRHLKEPKILVIEGNTEGQITLKLANTLNRIKAANETTTGDYEIEVINPSEAEHIKVTIAYSDVPFYYNPKLNNVTQLKAWATMHVSKVFDVNNNKIR